MKRLRKAELRFLPCKAALVMADLFLLVLLLGCIFQPEKFSDVTDYVFMSASAVCLLLLFAVTYSYFKPSYRIIPGISRILGRQELKKLFENENFMPLEKGILSGRVFVSEKWLEICGFFVPRNLIAMMWIDERGIGTTHFYVNFYLMTGQVVSIKYLIRARALKKDVDPLMTNIGVKAVFMQALEEYTRGIGIVHLSGITKRPLDERLLERGAELARDYGTVKEAASIVSGNSDLSAGYLDELRKCVDELKIETWRELFEEDKRYKRYETGDSK